MNVRLIFDLPHEKFGYVRPRDTSIPPLRGFSKNLEASCPRSTGQYSRSCNRPIEPASFNQALLKALILISAAKDDLKRQTLQAADPCSTIAGSKPSHTDQTFDAFGLHRRDQHSGRIREQVYGPEQAA